MPAFFNGVFGHKCSSGLIPNTGQHPIAENDAAPYAAVALLVRPAPSVTDALGCTLRCRLACRYLTTGPIVRHVEDLWPLVRLLAGPDGRGTGSKPLSDFPLLKSVGPAGVDMAKVRVLTVPNLNKWRPPMSSTISKAVMDACVLCVGKCREVFITLPDAYVLVAFLMSSEPRTRCIPAATRSRPSQSTCLSSSERLTSGAAC